MKFEGAAIGLALALDVAAGQLPTRLHPVGWMGWLIRAGYGAPGAGRRADLIRGAAATGALVGSAALAGWALERFAKPFERTGWIVPALALWTSVSLSGLYRAAKDVARAVRSGRVDEARNELRHLVGRDVGQLEPTGICSATVESVAENVCDSVAAPLFYYAVAGLPGLLAYRMINTADAMVGYRGTYEYLGKVAARVDDLANLVPARLTALTMIPLAIPAGGSARGALRALLGERDKTASPNAGWTMSVAAGAFGVTLTKNGAYKLDGGSGKPDATTILKAVRLTILTSMAWCAVATAIVWRRGAR